MTIVGTELNEHFSDSTMRMSLLINVEGLVNDWLMVGLVISLGEELLYAAHVWNWDWKNERERERENDLAQFVCMWERDSH